MDQLFSLDWDWVRMCSYQQILNLMCMYMLKFNKKIAYMDIILFLDCWFWTNAWPLYEYSAPNVMSSCVLEMLVFANKLLANWVKHAMHYGKFAVSEPTHIPLKHQLSQFQNTKVAIIIYSGTTILWKHVSSQTNS